MDQATASLNGTSGSRTGSAANINTSLVFAKRTAPREKIDWKNIPKKKRHLYQPKFAGVEGNSKLNIAKPFTKKAHRIITNKTLKLIRRRNEVDRDLLAEVEKEKITAQDWLARDKLLRRQRLLERREERHLRARTAALEQRERLYRWDPSTDRARDLDLIRELLWKFKRNLGPMMAYHKSQEGKNELSSGSEWSGVDDAGHDSDWADEHIDSDSDDSDYEVTKKSKRSKSAAKSSKKEKGKRKSDSSSGGPPAKKQKKDDRASKTSDKKTSKVAKKSNVKTHKSSPETSDSDAKDVRTERPKKAAKSKSNSADLTEKADEKGAHKRGESANSKKTSSTHHQQSVKGDNSDTEPPFFQQRALDLISGADDLVYDSDWDLDTDAMTEGKYLMSGAMGEPDPESLFPAVAEYLRVHPTGNGETSSGEPDSSQVTDATTPSPSKSGDKSTSGGSANPAVSSNKAEDELAPDVSAKPTSPFTATGLKMPPIPSGTAQATGDETVANAQASPKAESDNRKGETANKQAGTLNEHPDSPATTTNDSSQDQPTVNSEERAATRDSSPFSSQSTSTSQVKKVQEQKAVSSEQAGLTEASGKDTDKTAENEADAAAPEP